MLCKVKIACLVNFIAISCSFNIEKAIFYESSSKGYLPVLNQWNLSDTIDYLQRFGFLSEEKAENLKKENHVDTSNISRELRNFQDNFGIPVTGILDQVTIKTLSQPVCDVQDFDTNPRNQSLSKAEGYSKSKRYVLAVLGGKWRKGYLKYYIRNFTPDLSPSQVDGIIKRAFELWASYTNLNFEETLNQRAADFELSFETGVHGDGHAFPARGGMVAHAFYPSSIRAGTVHFNDWFKFRDGGIGYLLYPIAVHEIGHGLGLGHCRIPEFAVMCHTYRWNASLGLHADDIAAIQELYGEKRTTPMPSRRNICSRRISFDTMHFDHRTEALYAFKGNYFWKINDFGVMDGYPKRIGLLWNGLPGHMTASFHSKSSSYTYFFKGNHVWRYFRGQRVSGYPKKASEFNIPANPDAAVKLGKGVPYVIKGKYIYEFPEFLTTVTRNRTQIRDVWPNAPVQIDSAIQWKDGKVYFFKKNNYWPLSGFDKIEGLRRFSGWRKFKGIRKPRRGPFPKSFKKHWLGCK